MIYLVSGFMRSGTSMMMRALEAGGLTVARDAERDRGMNARWGETSYLPNERYYELLEHTDLIPDFTTRYDGMLVKSLYGSVVKLPAWQYRVIFMRRPVEDIRLSMLAAFKDRSSLAWGPRFDFWMDRTVDVLRDRRSFVTVDEVWFDDVIADPLRVFGALDWPIDPAAAAAVPMRQAKRFSHA